MDQERRTLDFLRLFVRHQQEIYAYILTLVPHVHDADDLFQEGMTVMWRKFDQFEPGTEFGVITGDNGRTEVHALTGHVSVALDPNRSDRTDPFVLGEGLAAVVDASGRTLQGGLPAQKGRFLVDLPKAGQPACPAGRLNLADIVGGGNGYGTGTPDRGIDLMTGQVFSGPVSALRRSRRSEFRPLPQLRAIDGVFVPNGSYGPVVVSSTGLTFDRCPTTAGIYYGGPANSGKVTSNQDRRVYAARLDGVEYGSLRHPALSLHPNAGITFDLDEIRADNPGVRIERFTALCGISENIPFTRSSPADVWVLLDGSVRFHLHFPMDKNIAGKVDLPIPIASETRFLTLVAACPGNIGFSWIFFGDPMLELAVRE